MAANLCPGVSSLDFITKLNEQRSTAGRRLRCDAEIIGVIGYWNRVACTWSPNFGRDGDWAD